MKVQILQAFHKGEACICPHLFFPFILTSKARDFFSTPAESVSQNYTKTVWNI